MSKQGPEDRLVVVHGELTPVARDAHELPKARYQLTLVLNADNEMRVRAGYVELPARKSEPTLPRVFDDGEVIVTYADDGLLLGVEFLAAEPFPQFQRHVEKSAERALLTAAHATVVSLWRIVEHSIKIIAESSPADTFTKWDAKRSGAFCRKLTSLLSIAEDFTRKLRESESDDVPARWRAELALT